MTKLKIISDFPYYHGGCNRVDYEAGQVVEIDDEEMIEVAIDQGWAESEDPEASEASEDPEASEVPEVPEVPEVVEAKPQHKGKAK